MPRRAPRVNVFNSELISDILLQQFISLPMGDSLSAAIVQEQDDTFCIKIDDR